MKIRVLLVGKTRNAALQKEIDVYLKRIMRSVRIEECVVRDESKGPPEQVRTEEGKRLLARLDDRETVVLLDETGKLFDTRGFADKLQSMMMSGKDLAFVIGGAWGVSDAIRERADVIWSLSPLTFPHQLVRLIFAEQLYRAFSVIRGEPYHH